MMRNLFAIGLAALLTLGQPALSCPSCMPIPPTAAQEIENAQAIAIGVPLKKGGNRYRIESVLVGRLAKGRVVLALPVEGAEKVLLTTSGSEGNPFWSGQPRPWHPELSSFISQLRKLPARGRSVGHLQRLQFFLPYLNSKDSIYAESAYAEFAEAPYKLLSKVAPKVGVEKLRSWLKSPTTPPEYRSLYWTMLASCGEKEDFEWAEAEVRKARQRPVTGYLGALLLCYLELGGDSALDVVESQFLMRDRARQIAALQAMRMLLDENSRISRELLLAACRRQLKDLDLASGILRDLALWKDWQAVPIAIGLLEQPDRYRHVRLSALRYLLACPLPQAQDKLDELRKANPAEARDWPPPFR